MAAPLSTEEVEIDAETLASIDCGLKAADEALADFVGTRFSLSSGASERLGLKVCAHQIADHSILSNPFDQEKLIDLAVLNNRF